MAFNLNGSSRLPHALRFVVFLLRLAIGLDFFYLGLSTVFDPGIRRSFAGRSLGDLYSWLANVSNANSLQTMFAWAFLIIGACLILGFATRIATVIGVGLTGASFWPIANVMNIRTTTFVSDGIIVILCLIILFIANAGSYLGIDQFFRVHVGKHAE